MFLTGDSASETLEKRESPDSVAGVGSGLLHFLPADVRSGEDSARPGAQTVQETV